MLQNLILLIIALVTLLFVGLLWTRHSLFQSLQAVQQHEMILQKDFDKRRDTVPYLLEATRQVEEPTDTWRKLAEDRSVFNLPPKNAMSDLALELEFEKTLNNYLQSSTYRNVSFLDAKKDIEELNVLIEKEKSAFHEAVNRFNKQKKEFPYSLVSGIFGLREWVL